MSDDQKRQNRAPQEGGWQPIPRGAEYDADGTAFVQLPPELLAQPGAPGGWAPLAAPGTGYTPPAATAWQQAPQQPNHPNPPEPARDPATPPGDWTAPYATDPAPEWAAVPTDTYDPAHGHAPDGAVGTDPHTTAQWSFTTAPASVDGPADRWSIPAAGDDPVDESGEYPLRTHADPAADPATDLQATAEWPAPSAGDTGSGAWHRPGPDAAPGTGSRTGPAGQWTTPGTPDDTTGESGESGEYALAPHRNDGSTPPPGTDRTVTGDKAADAWTTVTDDPSAPGDPAVPGDQPRPTAETGPEPEAANEPEPEPGPGAGPQPAEADHPSQPAPEPTEDDGEPAAPDELPHTEHPCASYVLRVNGTDRPVTDAWIGESLLYVLRERLGLAGAKDGCAQGECGACSVQVDGRLVASCLVPAATAAGCEVRTVEGLAVDGRPSDVQRALAACGAVQCGFCVPGLAMTVHDLLEGNHTPTELETRQAICGNLCRCSGYRGVLAAVRQVVDERAERAEAAAAQDETAQATDRARPETETARIPHQAGPHNGGSGKATA